MNPINTMAENLTLFMRDNLSWILNSSDFDLLNGMQLDMDLIERFQLNRRVHNVAFYTLIFLYSMLIVVGAAGNSLVVVSVIRQPAMRTARNVFIINLAISDLFLCLVTMPLTLVELLSLYWPFGYTEFLCRLVGSLQATSIFVSTISITAIALDRYYVIVYPTKESLKTTQAVATLPAVWIVAFVLALPNFIWRKLTSHEVNLHNLESVNYCFEEFPSEHGRGYYSLFSIFVQYCLPIATVSVAYFRICVKLKYRMTHNSAVRAAKKADQEGRRMKRTNTLLIAISLIFCLSWLPLNLFNLVVDFFNPFGDDTETMLIVYAVCHMVGMSSACSNPLLYGWLNENFRKEFLALFAILFPCCQNKEPMVPVRVCGAQVLNSGEKCTLMQRINHSDCEQIGSDKEENEMTIMDTIAVV